MSCSKPGNGSVVRVSAFQAQALSSIPDMASLDAPPFIIPGTTAPIKCVLAPKLKGPTQSKHYKPSIQCITTLVVYVIPVIITKIRRNGKRLGRKWQIKAHEAHALWVCDPGVYPKHSSQGFQHDPQLFQHSSAPIVSDL